MKQTLITITICAIFTVINFGFKTEAQSETILDHSWIEGDEIYIGNWDNYISLDMGNGDVYIRGKNFYTQGNSTTNGNMLQFYISGQTGKIGAWGTGTNGTMLIFSDEGNEITASPKIAGHQLETP